MPAAPSCKTLLPQANTVIVVEHDMQVIAGSDWIIDMGPGAGDEGGQIVAAGPPAKIARSPSSRAARFLAHLVSAEDLPHAAPAGASKNAELHWS
jgi:excinuclease ABC subunit A